MEKLIHLDHNYIERKDNKSINQYNKLRLKNDTIFSISITKK